MSASPSNNGDVFDDVFALLTPERLLHDPRATGEGVTVCLIDSGVDQAVLEERFRQRGQQIYPIAGGIFTAGSQQPLPYEGKQSTPHGTTVADIVLSLAPRVRLYSADVFGPQGSCELDVVMQGDCRMEVQDYQSLARRARAAPATGAAALSVSASD